jgi:hypothetical protein
VFNWPLQINKNKNKLKKGNNPQEIATIKKTFKQQLVLSKTNSHFQKRHKKTDLPFGFLHKDRRLQSRGGAV